MVFIVEGAGDISKLLHTKKILPSHYRVSKFLLKKDVGEGFLVCNTIIGELIYLSQD